MSLLNINPANTFLSKDGFMMFRHPAMNGSQHSEAYPVEFLCEGQKVYCYLNPIPYDEHYTKLVFFVTGRDGKEYGQFRTQLAALKKYDELEAL